MKWLRSNTSDTHPSNGASGAKGHRPAKGLRAVNEGPGSQVNLGAFGKHPGWNDHIEDLGMETQRLVDVKRVVYIEGIGGNIDSGAWDKLEDDQRLEGFHHVFIWRTVQDVVVGRLWSSQDGKGRTRYPMIVCAQCIGLPISWVIDQVLPLLERIEQECVATTESERVRSIVDSARRQIRAQAQDVSINDSDPVDDLRSLVQVADAPAMGTDHEGLLRILYQLDREMPGLASVRQDTATKSATSRPHQIRVPTCEQSAARIARLWTGFLRALLPEATPFLFLFPLGQTWVDLIIGEPARSHFYAVKAHSTKLPLTTEIPYNLDSAFIERAQALISWAQAEIQNPTPASVTRAPQATTRSTDRLASDRSAFSAKMIAIVTIVILIIVTAGYLMRGDPTSTPPDTRLPQSMNPNGTRSPGSQIAQFDEKAWMNWCQAYANWFGRFSRDLDSQARETIATDPHLRSLLETLDQAARQEIELDPSRLAGAPGTDLLDLATHPTKRVMTPEGIRKTKMGLAVIKQIRDGLSDWPARIKAQEAATTFGSLGWEGLSRWLQSLADQAHPSAETNLIESITNLLTSSRQVTEIENLWSEISQLRSTIEQSGDRVLARFGGWAQAAAGSVAGPSSPDLDRLHEILVDIKSLAQRLAKVVRDDWSRIDHHTFAADSQGDQPSNEPVNEKVFTKWLRDVKAFYRPGNEEDPRQHLRLAERLNNIHEDVKRLKDREDYQPSRHVNFDDRLGQIEISLEDLEALPWIVRDQAQIQRAAHTLDTDLRSLDQSINEVQRRLAVALQDYVEALRSQPQIAPSGSSVIDEQWQKHRDEIIQSEQDYPTLERKIDELESVLIALDQKLPTGLPDEALTTSWSQALARPVLWEQREQVMRQMLDRVRWVDGVPIVDDPSKIVQSAGITPFMEFREKVETLVADFAAIERLLNTYHSFNEAPVSGESSINQLHRKWVDDELFQNPAVQKTLATSRGQIQQLQEIDQTQDRAVLWSAVQNGGDAGLAVYFAAWRRLDDFPWPADSQTRFDQMFAIQRQMKKQVQKIDDPQRREVFHQEMLQRGRARWRMHVDGIDEPLDYETAIAHMKTFDVKVDELDPRNRFNVLLYQIKQTKPGLSEQRLQDVIQQFHKDVNHLPQGFIQRDEVASFLIQSGELLSEEPVSDTTQFAPEKMGLTASPIADAIPWHVAVEDDGARLIYTWDTNGGKIHHELEFVRVASDDSTDAPFFLCTTEVSVGLFIDVVSQAGRWPDFIKLLRDYSPGDLNAPKGPFVWKWKSYGKPTQAAKKNNRWLLGLFASEDYTYPDHINPGQPTDDHPMQQVSAPAAMYFANLLGCRLPSRSQWQAAYQIVGQNRSAMHDNLRDETWLGQKDHVTSLVASGTSIIDWPDSGIFWPVGIPDGQRLAGRDAVERTTDSDGFLWFGPVGIGSGRPFRNMIGNVAEFVFDAPQEVGQLAVTPADTPEGVQQIFDAHSDALYVIGGSALSPPRLKLDQPYPVDSIMGREGYSDVGFRLAFAVPDESLQQKFRRVVTAASYLTQ